MVQGVLSGPINKHDKTRHNRRKKRLRKTKVSGLEAHKPSVNRGRPSGEGGLGELRLFIGATLRLLRERFGPMTRFGGPLYTFTAARGGVRLVRIWKPLKHCGLPASMSWNRPTIAFGGAKAPRARNKTAALRLEKERIDVYWAKQGSPKNGNAGLLIEVTARCSALLFAIAAGGAPRSPPS